MIVGKKKLNGSFNLSIYMHYNHSLSIKLFG